MSTQASLLITVPVQVQVTAALCDLVKPTGWRHGAYGRHTQDGKDITYGVVGSGERQEDHIYSYPKLHIVDISQVRAIQLFRQKSGETPEAVTILIQGDDLRKVKEWGGTTNDGEALGTTLAGVSLSKGRHSPDLKKNEDASFDLQLHNDNLRKRYVSDLESKWVSNLETENRVEKHRTAVAKYEYFWEVFDMEGKKLPNVYISVALGPANAGR